MISKQLKKFLNARILDMLQKNEVPPTCNNIKVGWNETRAFWAHRTRSGKWVLRSGRKFPAKIATPRELDVDLGYTAYSLSGIIPPEGTVGGMM